MFVLAAALATAVGLLRGGSLRAFGDARFRRAGLVFAAFAIRFGLAVAGARGWNAVAPVAPAAHLVSYALLLDALWCNRRLPGAWLLAAGTVLNAAVIAANGARMPVLPAAMVAIGRGRDIAYLAGHGDYMHALMGPGTRLAWLGDRFVLPLLHTTVFSLGDALIVAGLFVLIQGVMRVRPHGRTAPARRP
jgi:hypothetical protein